VYIGRLFEGGSGVVRVVLVLEVILVYAFGSLGTIPDYYPVATRPSSNASKKLKLLAPHRFLPVTIVSRLSVYKHN
jgi:hypothetical protein